VAQLTRLIVLGSLVSAVSYETWYAAFEWRAFYGLSAVAVTGAFLAARRWPRRATGVVFAAGYLVPLLFAVSIGFHFPFQAFWAWLLLGVVLTSAHERWHVPAMLQFPLSAWGLSVALGWPLVALRELDWIPSLLWARPAVHNPGIHAVAGIARIAQSAELHLLGVVWLDWLFGVFRKDTAHTFERAVIRPALVTAAICAGVAVHQGAIDPKFVETSWAEVGRASGSLIDANASGSLMALWMTIPLVFMASSRGRGVLALAAASGLFMIAIWMTGSRTSLLAALVSLLAVAHLTIIGAAKRRTMLIAMGSAALALLVLRMAGASAMVGPIERIRVNLMPTLDAENLPFVLRQLWQRNGYGSASAAMFMEYPLQGVGVGGLPGLVGEYATEMGWPHIPPDNAQNWFRHQLAELGLVGSVGWILWAIVLARAFLRRASDREDVTRAVVLKYAIAGFVVASLVGMPGQNLFVAMTMWTLAFWLLSLTFADTQAAPRRSVSKALGPAMGLLLACVYAVATIQAGWNDLRPPFRAKRFNYPYQYGFIDPVLGAVGATRTTDHGVAVPLAPTGKVKLTFWVEHPDADRQPVLVEAWLDDRRIVRGQFARGTPLVRVETVEAAKRFVLEARVDRTFAAADTPGREGGLTVRWDFLTE
jgi:O-antigen ligase